MQEESIAATTAKDDSGDVVLVEPIQDMTAHEPAGSCQQDFQSENSDFFADFTQFFQREVDLLVGMGGHQADADQFLSRRYPW